MKLKNKSEQAETDKELAAGLNEQAIALSMKGEYDAALPLVQKALALAEHEENTEEMARCFNIHGIILRNQGEYTNALEYLNQALVLFRQSGNKKMIVNVLNNIGVVFRNLADYSKTLDYYQEALSLCEEFPEDLVMANVLGNVGNVYRNLEDYHRALEYYQRALAIVMVVNDRQGVERHLGNIGNAYSNLREFDIALEYQQKALQISEEIGNKSGVMIHLGNIGNILLDLGKYSEAMELYLKALAIAKDLGIKSAVAEWLRQIGCIYSTTDYEDCNEPKAEKYLLESIALHNEAGEKAGEFATHKELASLYKRQKRWQEFAIHFEKYHELERQVQSLAAKKEAERFVHEREITVKNLEQAILSKKNEELEEANLFKTKLLGIAAHDLKNPLSNIIGAAQIVLSELQGNEQAQEWLVVIEVSARRMSMLINELLESSAASLGAIYLSCSTFDIGRMCRYAAELHEVTARKKNQRVEFDIEGSVIINADEARMIQVVENLISNALKYSPSNAVIHLSVSARQDTVLLSVRDEGQGLSDEDTSKLFGQFQRLSSVPTGGESSTGLGLHIVKHIIELHNGRIWAESKGKGHGTTFFVEIPLSYN